jgi:hypothetical protein
VKLAVVCVLRTGGDFLPEHVTVLANQVRRHLTVPYEFVCLTNVTHAIEGVDRQIPLEKKFLKTWCKMEMFRPGLFEGQKVLYMDLDIVILQAINDLPDLCGPGEFWSLHGWRKDRAMNLCSAVMIWQGEYPEIYESLLDQHPEFIASGESWFKEQKHVERGILAREDTTLHFIQEHYSVCSYKWHCREGIDAKTKLVVFHGIPRPWEVKGGWVKEYWK